MTEVALSIIIPARNEAAMVPGAVESALRAAARLDPPVRAEVIVVDNASTDATRDRVGAYAAHGVQLASCALPGASRARNAGAQRARGRAYVFMDADTRMPDHALDRVLELCRPGRYGAGIARLASLEGGVRAKLWWSFWGQVRRLPLARAKAMPAFMFCTREVFEQFGPFDEGVAIGEEWPILAGLYRAGRRQVVYDRALTAHSSNRRMELQPFGYTANFLKYCWAVVDPRGRTTYTDRYRHAPAEARCRAVPRAGAEP